MKIKLPGYLKTILKIAVTVAALWFVFSKIPFREVLQSARGASASLLALAGLCFILSKAIAGFRLNFFFRSAGVNIGETFNLKLYLLGMFYNLFLPGGIGGDGYKIYLLNRKTGVPGTRVFWAVLLDRLSGVMALGILATILFYFTPLEAGMFQPLVWLLIPASLLAAWLLLRIFLKAYLSSFPATTFLSLLVQTSQLGSAWFILMAFGQESQFSAYLFLFLVSSIIAMVPVTIGGVGSREFTFLLGAGYLQLDTGLSIALSLMFYLVTLVVSFTGIIYVIRPGSLRLDRT